MEKSKENRYRKTIAFLGIVCFVLTFSALFFGFEASSYRRRERLVNEKAVSSLCESLDEISTSLKKSLYSADKTALSKTGNELCRQAASAKESLSLLSPENEFSDEIYKFLSQVGNYTLALAQGESDISEREAKGLRELYTYASKLSDGMNEICYDYYNGDVSFGDAIGNLQKETESPDTDFYGRVYDTAQNLSDYPTLVYDGPFADNIASGKSVMLEKESEITAEEAAEKVAEMLGVQASALKKEEDINSELELYCFSKGKTDVTVTKKGGYICSVLSEAYAYEETISAQEAVKRGKEYLEKLGYKNMRSSYYSLYDGICTVNYAYEDEGVICYADLIKVAISLDTGKLVALDAKPYLLAHTERSRKGEAISENEAANKLSTVLDVIDSRLAYIPLETGKDALCYEFHCKDSDGQEVLVYVDAYTAVQRDILILLYSDGGIMTK